MIQVIVTGPAEADVAQIVIHLTKAAGYEIAARYLGAFDAVYDRLAEFPDMGPPRRSLGRDTRIALVHPYVMVYDHSNDRVIVLRVLHGARNITRRVVRQPER
jgi:toxin ParE1/3/4